MENYKETQFKYLAYLNNLDDNGKQKDILHHEYLHKRVLTAMFIGAVVLTGILVYVRYTLFPH
jgi:hypothetical protein